MSTADGSPTRPRWVLAIPAMVLAAVIGVAGVVERIHELKGPGRHPTSCTIGEWLGRTLLLGVAGLLFAWGLSRIRRPDGSARNAGLTQVAILVVCVGGGLALTAVVERAASDARNAPNGSYQRARFVAECRRLSGGGIDCVCFLDRLTAGPPFDWLGPYAAFADVAARLGRVASGDVPAAVASAVGNCRKRTA